MKYALKSVPGLADIGVPNGDEDGPGAQAHPHPHGGPQHQQGHFRAYFIEKLLLGIVKLVI